MNQDVTSQLPKFSIDVIYDVSNDFFVNHKVSLRLMSLLNALHKLLSRKISTRICA